MNNVMIEVTDTTYKQVVKEVFSDTEIPTEKFISYYPGDAGGFTHYELSFLNKALSKEFRCFYEVFQDIYYCASLKGKTTKNKIIVTSVNLIPKYSNFVEYETAIKNQVTKKWLIECTKNKKSTLLIFQKNIDI